MNELISPKYLMKLIQNIKEAIWVEYPSYKEVMFYIEKWHEEKEDLNYFWENFTIATKENGDIDLLSTLHKMEGNLLLKVAIDLGIETPDFIPSIPTFRNEIKSDYKTAYATFEKAYKQIETHPDIAIGLANSALESIIKEILLDDRISCKIKRTETLYELTSEILKAFHLYPDSDMPIEIRTMGSSLMAVNQSIEKLRSEKTNVHGKTDDDYVITDPIYTYFVVNTVVTIGLFLNSFYKNKFPKQMIEQETDDRLPF